MGATKQKKISAAGEKRKKSQTAGKLLRKERLALHWSLDQVSSTLKIRKDYLKAIETDDYRALPEETYAIGFVRAYAKLLRLDPAEISQAFCDEYHTVIQPQSDEPSLQVIVPTHKPQKRILLTSLVILIVLLVIWFGATSEHSGALFDELSQRVSSVVMQTHPDKPSDPEASGATSSPTESTAFFEQPTSDPSFTASHPNDQHELGMTEESTEFNRTLHSADAPAQQDLRKTQPIESQLEEQGSKVTSSDTNSTHSIEPSQESPPALNARHRVSNENSSLASLGADYPTSHHIRSIVTPSSGVLEASIPLSS